MEVLYMSFLFQILLFSIPGVLIYYGIFVGTPKLVKKGVPLIYAFWFHLWFPVLILLPFALLLYKLEGGIFTIDEISKRFRLHPIQGMEWLWIVGAVIFTILFDQLLEPAGKYFARFKLLKPPNYLPAPFNPLKKFTFPPKEFFEVELCGNWKLLPLFMPLHILAMFSEEIMWRGYILPLQEISFGNWAWVVNGILWAWIVHAALKWHFVGMLPSMLIAPFIAQQTGSTWASFAVHALGNSPLWILLLIGVIQPKSKK
jgi:membrane protease YdiL (CAAX protease family)